MFFIIKSIELTQFIICSPQKWRGGVSTPWYFNSLYAYFKSKMFAAKKGSGLPLPLSRCYVSVNWNVYIYEKIHSKCRNFNYIGFVDLNIWSFAHDSITFSPSPRKKKTSKFRAGETCILRKIKSCHLLWRPSVYWRVTAMSQEPSNLVKRWFCRKNIF